MRGLGARWGVGGQHHVPATLPSEKDKVSIVQEAGWAWRPDWTCVEKRITRAHKGVEAPDRPAPSKAVYQLRYPRPPPWRWPTKHCIIRIQSFVNMPLNFRERNLAKSLFSSLFVSCIEEKNWGLLPCGSFLGIKRAFLTITQDWYGFALKAVARPCLLSAVRHTQSRHAHQIRAQNRRLRHFLYVPRLKSSFVASYTSA